MLAFINDVFVDCDIPSVSPTLPIHSSHFLCSNHLEWNRQNSTQRNYLYKGPKLNSIKFNSNTIKHENNISCYHALQISVLSLGVLILLGFSALHLCTHVSYVTFNTDLNLYSKKKSLRVSTPWVLTYLTLMLVLLLLSDCENEQIVLFIIRIYPNMGNVVGLSPKSSKIISRAISGTLSLFIFSISITPATSTVCLIVFQIWCHSYVKRVPRWLPIVLIILSNDINLNPGPQPHFQNNSFNFMSWNVNSLAKNNFQRVRLIEAHNSIFNYDLISICETSLNDLVELPETLLNDYTFVPANNTVNTRNGGWDFSIRILFQS